jgi:pregnancy-associated plasma protein-A
MGINAMKKNLSLVRSCLLWLVVTKIIFGSAWLIDATQSTSAQVATAPNQKSRQDASVPFRPAETIFHSPLAIDRVLVPVCVTRPDLAPPPMIDQCFLGSLRSAPAQPRLPASVKIDVYFHVLQNSKGEGVVDKKVLENQIDVLNKIFSGNFPDGIPTPFKFELKDTEITENDEWFNMEYSANNPTPAERDAKNTLNKPGKSTLNIYTAKVDGPLGWARLPWQQAAKVDGVVVRYTTLPGGKKEHYNQGDVVVHEVGHWLGLFHTCEHGCDPPGDCVDDTNKEASPKLQCQTDQQCDDGDDPTDNLMNDTFDECRDRFTLGQVRRMDEIHRLYRT